MNIPRTWRLMLALLLAALLAATAGCGPAPETAQPEEMAAGAGEEPTAVATVAAEDTPTEAATPTSTDTPEPTATPTEVPTNTPTASPTEPPTETPTPRPSPTPTPVPTDTPVPEPDAVVIAPTLSLYMGPGTDYYSEPVLSQGDELLVWAQYDDCTWLMLEDPPGAWVPGGSDSVELRTECAAFPPPPPGSFRPFTGLVSRNLGDGMGELLIKNGTDADALAVLATLDDQAVQSAYIRAEEQFQMMGIPDGSYRLYFHKGSLWDSASNQFTSDPTYQRFEDLLPFETTASQYTGYEVTLFGVAGGTAATESVDPGQFPGP